MSIPSPQTPDSGTTTQTENPGDELTWARASLGGVGTGRPRRYLVRPGRSDPQLLLPLSPTAVTSASLRRYHDDRSLPERLTGLGGQILARSGLVKRTGGDVMSLEPFGLVETIAAKLGEPELVATVSLGPRRRNRKPVVQLLRPDGTTVGFAKIGWSPFTRELVSNEARWLRAVDGRMPAGLVAPAVLHQATVQPDSAVDPVDVVVTAPIRTSFFSHRRDPIPIETIVALSRLESGGHRELAGLPLVADWRRTALAELVDLDALVQRHGGTTVETGLWHGDLTPWNSATSAGVSSVWDWEFAGDGRPVGFDAMHLAFEQVRRAQPNNEAAAIKAVIEKTPDILRSIPGPQVTSSVDAVIDLYLAELLARETRLAGEGWRPEHLGPLDQRLRDTLADRLMRPGP